MFLLSDKNKEAITLRRKPIPIWTLFIRWDTVMLWGKFSALGTLENALLFHLTSSIRLPKLCIQHVPINPCMWRSLVTKLYIRLWDLGFESSISQASHDSRDMHFDAAKSDRLLTPISQNLQHSTMYIGDIYFYIWSSYEDIKKFHYFTEDNTAYNLRKPTVS